MKRSLIAAALALAVLSAPAHARHYRHHHRAVGASGRPAACAGIAWCGCWLRLKLGISDARLNVARAWATVGSAAAGPARGVIAVWRHHVGLVTADLGGGNIMLLSGNDRGAVRERPISTHALGGVIAWRRI
jgi:hypothetical protein